MGNYDIYTPNRSWVITVQIANMENAGLTKQQYESPEFLANFLMKTWQESGKNRTCGVAICVSATGLYHAHLACYGNTTTLRKVAKIFWGSHVEPQEGGKKQLKEYLLKEGKYAEKGEQILYSLGIENIQNAKGHRSDLDEIDNLLRSGCSPSQIFEESFSYRRYEKMIQSEYIAKRRKETPRIKNMRVEWHVGDAGTGKSYTYELLCQKFSEDMIYLCTDTENGGLDYYLNQGVPPILFLDEFKGNMKFEQLLVMLDKYSRAQIHSRYTNVYALWNQCIITSIYPPEEVYESMVSTSKRGRDKLKQLMRRLTVIVYHYIENGQYKTFELPASEYVDYEDLKQKALSDSDGFIKYEQQTIFNEETQKGTNQCQTKK